MLNRSIFYTVIYNVSAGEDITRLNYIIFCGEEKKANEKHCHHHLEQCFLMAFLILAQLCFVLEHSILYASLESRGGWCHKAEVISSVS